jgi:hypothetical protein
MTPSSPRRSDDPSPSIGWASRLLRACASLYLAVGVMLVLVVVLGWATCLEMWYGEPAAHFGLYGTWWFTALGALLGLNIFCALVRTVGDARRVPSDHLLALSILSLLVLRLPWKRSQTGFVVAHVGLLVLLVGCLITRRAGVEATLPVFEHQAAGVAYQDSQHFELTVGQVAQPVGDRLENPDATDDAPGNAPTTVIDIPFRPGPFNWEHYQRLPWLPWRLVPRDQGVIYDSDGIRLEVLDYYSNSRLLSIPRLDLLAIPAARPVPGHEADDSRAPITLSVQPGAGPHTVDNPYGMGTPRSLSGGQRVVFWMTGSPDETAAFRESAPDGPLGKQGRLVLRTQGKTYQFALDELKPGDRRPLGNTGLEIEMVEPDTRFNFNAVGLRVHDGKREPQPMFLPADFPEFNRHDYRDGVFGAYWRDSKSDDDKKPDDKQMPREAGHPRIDILQGADLKLYVRTWREGKMGPVGLLPTGGPPFVAFADTPDAVTLTVEKFVPSEKPDALPLPLPFNQMHEGLSHGQVRVRLTVDGSADEFWLGNSTEDPIAKMTMAAPPNLRRVVQAPDRRVAIRWRPDTLDLGVEVLLRQFKRVLDPGTDHAAEFSSRVDLVERPRDHPRSKGEGKTSSTDEPGKVLRQDVLISMNSPLNFTDPHTGRSYRAFQASFRGPWPAEQLGLKPSGGDDELVYVSFLTVASDPGRAMKYLGCLLIVVGVFIRYYMKWFFMRKRS